MLRTKEPEALNLKTTNGATSNGGGGAFRLDIGEAYLQVGRTTLRNVELGVTTLSAAYAGIVGGDLFDEITISETAAVCYGRG